MAPLPTAVAALARIALAAARARGRDPVALAEEAGISALALEIPGARVPVDSLMRLYELLPKRLGDEDIGFKMALEESTSEESHALIRAACVAGTLGDGIRLLTNLVHLANETTVAGMELDGDVAVMFARPRSGHWPRAYTEKVFGRTVYLMRQLVDPVVSLRGASFQHPAPADVTTYQRVLGAPLQFSAPRNELRFDAARLGDRLVGPDLEVRAHLFGEIGKLDRTGQVPRPLVDQVRESLRPMLPNGRVTISDVARALGMSSRTLQRRLADEDLRFGEILDQARRERALALIDEEISLAELAGNVGFQQECSLRDAFRRWVGMTPSEYRARRRGERS